MERPRRGHPHGWHAHLPAAPITDLVRYKRLGEKEFYGRLFAQNSERSNDDMIEWLGSPARFSKPNTAS